MSPFSYMQPYSSEHSKATFLLYSVMSKIKCPIFLVYSQYKNKQDFLDIQYTLEVMKPVSSAATFSSDKMINKINIIYSYIQIHGYCKVGKTFRKFRLDIMENFTSVNLCMTIRICYTNHYIS